MLFLSENGLGMLMSFLWDNFLGMLIACIVLLIYIQVKKKLNYFADRGLPYIIPTWKDIYNTLFFFKVINEVPAEIYQRCRSVKSQYIGAYGPLLTPIIFVLDPELVETILIKDFYNFQDRHGFKVDFESNSLAGHLFNMKGDKWRTLRHKLVPTFTSGKLRGMVPIVEECADDLINDMNCDPSLRKDTNLKDLFKKYSIAVIASTAFGIDPKSIKDPNCQFMKMLKETVSPSISFQIKLVMALMFTKLFNLLKLQIFSKQSEDFIYSLINQSFEMRTKMGIKRNDFIQLLLELKEKGSVELDTKDIEQDEKENIKNLQPPTAKLELTDKLLAAQVLAFLLGGYENTAFSVTITTYFLSKHPEIQARVREEVKQQRDKHGALDYEALKGMKLLGACIDESLRFHPPLPNIMRYCNKDYTFSDGTMIEEGISVLLFAESFHLDPKYWTEPEKFNPDRFINGEVMPGTYFPFGDGPRICIAQRMALLVTKLMLAKIVLNYQIEPSDQTKEPVKLKIMVGADNEGGFWGNFKALNNKTKD